MLEVTLTVALLLILAAFVAGTVDSIAGGGGLITVPALLLAGLPPVQALATNKVQGAFGAGTAALVYARKGHVRLAAQILPAALSFAAAFVGSRLVPYIPTQTFRLILPVVLIGVALFFALKRGLTDADRHERLTPVLFTAAFVPAIALYDGLVGPGTGSFFMIGFVLLAGYGVLRATAHTKLLNFASNLGSIAAFALAGAPLWKLGLAMGAAQVLGAQLGAHFAMRNGAALIKPLLIVTSTAMALRLVWQML
ncbi:MAG: TSUP family transporter [Proteobacteria bacterium]|nr:TSUP family transporter [Pseudomonadota bacterium]MBS0571773.1 TSUP family transporter [Pseudomonadota bacterium]